MRLVVDPEAITIADLSTAPAIGHILCLDCGLLMPATHPASLHPQSHPTFPKPLGAHPAPSIRWEHSDMERQDQHASQSQR